MRAAVLGIKMCGIDSLWSCLPYILAVLMALFPRLHVAAAGYASAFLLADLYGHHALYRGPGTDSLFVVFLPLWNLLVIGPAGAALAWLLARRRGSLAA
jgi:hypothetical protein